MSFFARPWSTMGGRLIALASLAMVSPSLAAPAPLSVTSSVTFSATFIDAIDRDPPVKPARGGSSPTPPPVPPEAFISANGAERVPVEGERVPIGESIRSGERVALRIRIEPGGATLTLAEGKGELKRAPDPVANPGTEKFPPSPRFVLGGAAVVLASGVKGHSENAKAPHPPLLWSVELPGGIAIGARESGRALVLGAGAEDQASAPANVGAREVGSPAVVYAIDGELEIAASYEALGKGATLAIPAGHLVEVRGPFGFESPRPFSAQVLPDFFARYPSLSRIRSLAKKVVPTF